MEALLLIHPGPDNTLFCGQNRGEAKGPTKSLELGSTCLLPAWQRKGDGERRGPPHP